MNEENNGYVVNCCGVAPDESGRILDDSRRGSATMRIVTGNDEFEISALDGRGLPPGAFGLEHARKVAENRRRRPPRKFEVDRRKGVVAPTAAYNNRERD